MPGSTILLGLPRRESLVGPIAPLISSERPHEESMMYGVDQIDSVIERLASELSTIDYAIFEQVLVCPGSDDEIANEQYAVEVGIISSKTGYQQLIQGLKEFPATVSTVTYIKSHYILCTATYSLRGIENLTITDSSKSTVQNVSNYKELFTEHSPFCDIDPKKVTFEPQLYQRPGSTDCGPLSICNLLIKHNPALTPDLGDRYIDTSFLRNGHHLVEGSESATEIVDILKGVLIEMKAHSYPFLDPRYNQVAIYCGLMGMPYPERVLVEAILPHNAEIDPLVLANGLKEYFYWAEQPSALGIHGPVSQSASILFARGSAVTEGASDQSQLEALALNAVDELGLTTGDPQVDHDLVQSACQQVQAAPEDGSRTLLERVIEVFKSMRRELGVLPPTTASFSPDEGGVSSTISPSVPSEKQASIKATLAGLGVENMTSQELEVLNIVNVKLDDLVEQLADIREITTANPGIDQNELIGRILDVRSSGPLGP